MSVPGHLGPGRPGLGRSTPGRQAVGREAVGREAVGRQAPDLLVAAPMGIEATLISLAAPGLIVERTGMGTARAREAALAIAARHAAAVLVLGFCGGLDRDAVPGEVLIAEEVLAAPGEGNPHELVVCAGAETLAWVLSRSGLAVRRGTVACVSRLALGERRAQLRQTGAVAVDMESVWLAPGAGDRPFAVVRVVLDAPAHELMRPGMAPMAVRAARALGRVARVLEGLLRREGVHTVLSGGAPGGAADAGPASKRG
jgi:4-hydroxy-3-methylbut-2-en-1-yl diphosphate reductase